MKTNMRLKSTLWALAFAVAAVSCSDDLEENGGGTGITAEDGEGVYVTVNVGLSSGPMTKADPAGPSGGEEGDDHIEGTVEERTVHDINIYLIKASDITGVTGISSKDDGVKVASATTTKEGGIKIVGHGYTENIGGSTASDVKYHTANSVKLDVDPNDLTATAQKYYVFAVANLGKEVKFTDLAALRDAVGSKTGTNVWDGTAWMGESAYGKASNFVMSTHQMYDTGGASVVELSIENTRPENPAETTVYVERLAARIDMNIASSLQNGTAQVQIPIKIEGADETSTTSGDLIKLTGYQIVNQWKGDEYMLKRVVESTGTVTTYPSIPTTLSDIWYLGDETYNEKNDNKYAYVLDPETTQGKKSQGDDANPIISAAISADYENHYSATLNDKINTDFVKITTGTIQSTANTFSPILYTKENTLDLDNQIYGLMTGVIFQGVYTPTGVSKFKTDIQLEGGATGVGVEKDVYTANSDFYVIKDFANSKGSDYLCADLTAIGALSFSKISEEDAKTINLATILKVLFSTENTWGTDPNEVTLANFKAAVEDMDGGALNKAYKAYLQNILTPAEGTPVDEDGFASIISNVKWSEFLETLKFTEQTGGGLTVEQSEILYNTYNIAYYDGGTCYYPYWIRHANNGNNSDLGPMEFCIVRNNVYQLAVTGVKALGDPLPFVDPENTKGESKEAFLTVEIYVKNWVVRNNDNITL